MGYTGFEIKEGDVLHRVEALCRHLTTGGVFTNTSPTPLPDVERYIDDAYYWVLGELARNGYNIAVTDTEAKAVLCQMQSLDAAVQLEYSQPVGDGEDENTRFRGLAARRDRLVGSFLQTDALEQLGAVRDRNKSSFVELTGRSRSRKATVYGDSDVPQARFPRGFGQRADVPSRSGTETSGGADPSQA